MLWVQTSNFIVFTDVDVTGSTRFFFVCIVSDRSKSNSIEGEVSYHAGVRLEQQNAIFNYVMFSSLQTFYKMYTFCERQTNFGTFSAADCIGF